MPKSIEVFKALEMVEVIPQKTLILVLAYRCCSQLLNRAFMSYLVLISMSQTLASALWENGDCLGL